MAAGATYTPIATQTLGSAVSSVTFTSIPNTYTDLVLIMNIVGASPADTALQFNSDTGTNYSRTQLIGNGSTAGSQRSSNENGLYLNNGGAFGSGNIIANIQNYSNATTYKTVISRMNQNTTTVLTGATAGLWRSTSVITTVSINSLSSATYGTGSTFTLYGIASA